MGGLGVPTFKNRDELGTIAQNEGFTKGLELGVQRGIYAKTILSQWHNCTEYHLVDLYGQYKRIMRILPMSTKSSRIIITS